ncbi:MAG: PAS domain-containing protein [Gemmatimonadaceae bacterium]|nr:PAS domain-containing protein [Gloeobacterales cyanobacterium ES-bin-141]
MNTPEANPEFELLLEYLKRSRGFDFTGYKRMSLMRNVRKRMQTINIEAYDEYLDYLQVYPDEFVPLFNTLLINVTSFFRDSQAWDYIQAQIIPQISERLGDGAPIRLWSAGCASGAETYTLAMVLCEVLSPEIFQERVKIYATDIDEEALSQARQASYSLKEVAGVPPALLEKYFETTEQRYVFRKELRRQVIFGRHDLVQDAPISRVDLLVCRNTLMYFNTETQARILARFHFALQDSGFLFLGKAEMLFAYTTTFTAVDLGRRIFSKIPKLNLRDRLMLMAQTGNEEAIDRVTSQVRIREAAYDASPVAQLVVDLDGHLIQVNDRARRLFNLVSQNVGSLLQDLEISYRPVELRSCIEQVYAERRPVSLQDVSWQTPTGTTLYLDVQVVQLTNFEGESLGVSITFMDMTRFNRLQAELEEANQELEMAYEELQSTNEELETTNEELQSTVEELETTNEELQSTNEELETMNEELQSTNEELETMNGELNQRGSELNRLNAFLESILTSMRGGVAVVDADLHIQLWNSRSEDLWGLRADEVRKQHFLSLDIGLPVEQLKQPIRSCLNGDSPYSEMTLNATNRRGKLFQCKVTCTSLVDLSNDVQGVILVMEDAGGSP